VLVVVAAGRAAGQQPVAAGGTPPPADTLRNRLREEPRAAADGERLFQAFNCDGCHAVGAVGAVGPSLADGRWRYGGSDGAIFRSIQDGRPRGMPAFGGILPPEAIWRLVAYLESLAPATDVSTTSWVRK
jgi:cytochrome c oxidase cbb3-type subunit 3